MKDRIQDSFTLSKKAATYAPQIALQDQQKNLTAFTIRFPAIRILFGFGFLFREPLGQMINILIA